MWEALIYYIILACEALMGVFGIRFYEEPRYEVLARIDHRIEIRRYAPRLAAQIELPQANRRGRDEAFRALASIKQFIGRLARLRTQAPARLETD